MASSSGLRNRQCMEKLISTEDLREYFECPICFVVPRKPPIYACQTGHMICCDCRPRLHSCPTCRLPYPGEGEQNHRLYFAERLLEERVPISCTFAELGCDLELAGAAMKRHEESGCPFEPLPCELKGNGCTALVSRKMMQRHAEKCDFRMIECPLTPTCNEKIVKKFVMQHLQDAHLSSIIMNGIRIDQRLFIVVLVVCMLSIVINFYMLSFMLN